VRPISWVLAPTWGVDAIRESATGGSPLAEIGLALGLGAAYVGVSVLILDAVLASARRAGALSLS